MIKVYPLGVYSFVGIPTDVVKNSVAGIDFAVRVSEAQKLKREEKTDYFEHIVEPSDRGRFNGYDK